jgi:hypothetical protein
LSDQVPQPYKSTGKIVGNTPCRLSATAYSIYSQLLSIFGVRSSIRKVRTRHAVVTGTHFWRFDVRGTTNILEFYISM